MCVLRQRLRRRDLLRYGMIMVAVIFSTVVSGQPAEATSLLGLPVGKNGLPATWVGEALTVAMAFALPAVVAGLFVGARRVTQRLGKRSFVLVSLVALVVAIGAVVVDQRPEVVQQLVAWASQ